MESLNEVNWKHSYFLCTLNDVYGHAFPIKEVGSKLKTVFNPWMTKGLQKSSKKKQKLCNKFLGSKTNKNEWTYKSIFEILKEGSVKFYYSEKLDSCEQDMKKTWDMITEVMLVKLKLF